MNQCLYCSKQCTATSIFCDECKASLLRRHHPLDELLSQARPSAAVAPAQAGAETPLSSGKGAVGVLETHVLSPIIASTRQPAVSSTPLPRRRPLPRRMRIALIVFTIVGALSLITDGVLLVLNIARHHSTDFVSSTVQMAHAGAAFPGQSSAANATVTPVPARAQRGQPGPSSSPGAGARSTGTPPGGTITTGEPLLALSSSDLTFTYTRGQADPVGQAIQISNSVGTFFSWQAILSSSAPAWLTFAPAQGSASAGGSGQMNVNVNASASQLSLGTYSVQVTIKAMDSAGAQLLNSPQALSVQLTVLAPCSLAASPLHLSFQASLLQPNPSAQTVTLNEAGNCARPVSWAGVADTNWVVLSPSTGNDSGSGTSFQVTVQTKGMLLGTYTAHITVTAMDSAGSPVQGGPQMVSVTLSVIG
jgi:hypothetical protein